ncbi:MAG: single-stranded-DNA-specific exonuclease RecJ [Gammaproteobacteria bacterium]|nr:MAG: single-stranded-DNA-specific exonuclease RecJ [Gammaproteobacteria bacterium]
MSSQQKIVTRPVSKDTGLFDDELHPLLRRIYLARSIQSQDLLNNSLTQLPSPKEMKGMEGAVNLLLIALEKRQKILVVADFDADGATSCAVTLLGLRALGFDQVSYIVPNRFEYGYGLTPEIVELACEQNPDLIITVDNGISSIEGVSAAKEKNCAVLVTDHHLPGDSLPNADAIINPNQPGDSFPSKNLAGVGVAFYLLLALRSAMRERHYFKKQGASEPNLAELLDLVALGTVADVVPLDHLNRVLVYQGLQRIRSGRARPGILALLEVAKRQRHRVKSSDLGFAVGPRLNAAGRLEDMSIGIECLLEDNEEKARKIAFELDGLNRVRREIEDDMKAEAMTILQKLNNTSEQQTPFAICLFENGWHQGVIGIVASRIKEKFHRPVIAFAESDNGEIKGSARSIPGVHIRDVLSEIAAQQPQMLNKFGGHAMAAGLTLKKSDLSQFRELFNQVVEKQLAGRAPEKIIETDGELDNEMLTLDIAEQLSVAGPWGQGFPEPLFQGEFEVLQARIVAEKHLKLVLGRAGGGSMVDAIAFFVDDPQSWIGCPRIKVAYQLDINEYKGNRSLQLIVNYLEKLSS